MTKIVDTSNKSKKNLDLLLLLRLTTKVHLKKGLNIKCVPRNMTDMKHDEF